MSAAIRRYRRSPDWDYSRGASLFVTIATEPRRPLFGRVAGGRYLEIARGNDEVAFGRAACLDYNAEIVEIASAGEGLALYWRDGGVERLDRRTRP